MKTKSSKARQFVLEAIQSGRWAPGERLASERELAGMIGVNTLTVRRGLAELVAEGVIDKRPRVGNFVRDVRRAAVVAVVFPSYLLSNTMRHPVVGLEMQGAGHALDQKEYALNAFWYRPPHFWEDVGQLIVARGITGMILWGHTRIPPQEIRRLLEAGVHIVSNTPSPLLADLGISTFGTDQEAVEADILRGFVQRGHRRIVMVRYVSTTDPSAYRIPPAVRQVCEQHHLGSPQDLVCPVSHTVEPPDFSPIGSIFEQAQLPTAIMVPDELSAAEVFRQAYRRGLRVPEAFSLAAAWDSTPMIHPVPLTSPDSVHWAREVGRMAGAHLKKLMYGRPMPRLKVLMGTPVHWRESVRSASDDAKRDESPAALRHADATSE
jgi:DNA-binding LacI/PurR family transcriptional regulator